MKIGLYFGSFNPIHNGHLIIAQQMLNEAQLDEVWLIVSPQNPFKKENQLLDASQRLFLARTAVENIERIKVSNVEFSLPKPSYTINTLVYLSEKHPNHTFYIILGSDGYQNIENWKNGDVILKNYALLVYERPGFSFEMKKGYNIQKIKAPFLDISSTFIRKLIKEKKSIQFLVPDSVRESIDSNQFYH
jgi:nicotinate-nucleotide adenylyltransferase